MDNYNMGTNCPRCACQVSSERTSEAVIVCDNCGYTAEGPQVRFDLKTDKKTIKVITAISALFGISLVHSSHWAGSALEIIPLKAKQMAGMATTEDLRQIADICIARVKQDCTETALAQLSEMDPTDIEVRAELASFLMRSGDAKRAEAYFSQYFQAGGVSAEAAYEMAQLLAKQNRIDEASKYFDIALISKPDSLQVTIVQAYVKMLMSNSRFIEARTVIDSVRNQGESAKAFMTKEYDEINAKMMAKK